MNWGVYWHKRKSDGIIFYVGIWKAKSRPYSSRKRNNWWHNEVNKHGFNAEIISEGLTLEKACSLETYLIKSIGRRDLGKGSLVNLTDGGYNGNPSEETRKKMILNHKGMEGLNHSKKSRDKIIISLKGNTRSKGKFWSEESKNKLEREGNKNSFFGKSHSDETRSKMKEKWLERKQKNR